MKDVDFVIVTGLSGAGKTQAMKVLEDLYFFCIDNLPPALLPRLVDLHGQVKQARQFAIAIDIRVREYFGDLRQSLAWLENSGYSYHVIFLDCSDSVLIKRFSETRRLHPLVKGQATPESISENIAEERRLLADVREMAHVIIDTTDLRPMDLRVRLNEIYQGRPLHASLTVDLFSFGFKYGAPIDADIVFDVRFIANPFYIDELRPLTGENPAVADYVLQPPITQNFLKQFTTLVSELVPAYAREGKARLTIGIGCTGGQHRSVAIAIELARRLREKGIKADYRHRELSRGQFAQ
ncbi:MAG TPA: RNase adapter RapZ [Firmicutes bacterium]|nr:RNase adapter RapZ [Bacillota bacterium]